MRSGSACCTQGEPVYRSDRKFPGLTGRSGTQRTRACFGEHLIRRSGQIIHDRLALAVCWGRHSTAVHAGQVLVSGLAAVLAGGTAERLRSSTEA